MQLGYFEMYISHTFLVFEIPVLPSRGSILLGTHTQQEVMMWLLTSCPFFIV